MIRCSNIWRGKNVRTSRTMSLTYARTVAHPVAFWTLPTIVFTSNHNRPPKRTQPLWLMFRLALFRVWKKWAAPVHGAKTHTELISSAKICEICDLLTSKRIIPDEQYSRNYRCMRFLCRIMNVCLRTAMLKRLLRMDGAFTSQLQNWGAW